MFVSFNGKSFVATQMCPTYWTSSAVVIGEFDKRTANTLVDDFNEHYWDGPASIEFIEEAFSYMFAEKSIVVHGPGYSTDSFRDGSWLTEFTWHPSGYACILTFYKGVCVARQHYTP